MKTKFDKQSRNLLISLLLGDGTIQNNNVFKLSHCIQQLPYLEWKIKQLNNFGIRHTDIKSYTSTSGYNVGKKVVYCKLRSMPFTKTLRRVVYKPTKLIANRKLLNRLDALGVAIWYMDDGHINIRKNKDGNAIGLYIRLSTCIPKDQANVIILYFAERWDIHFYTFHEGRKQDSYSLCCGTKEGVKFINLVKKYVQQVPCMLYKIQYDLTHRRRPL